MSSPLVWLWLANGRSGPKPSGPVHADPAWAPGAGEAAFRGLECGPGSLGTPGDSHAETPVLWAGPSSTEATSHVRPLDLSSH